MMKLPRVTNNKVDLLLPTERQIKEWLSKAKQREDKLVYKAILLAIYTGMRLGEIGGLSKSCINTDEGSIDVKFQLNRFNEFNALLKNESSRRKIYVSKEVLADTYSHWLDNMDKKAAIVIENLF